MHEQATHHPQLPTARVGLQPQGASPAFPSPGSFHFSQFYERWSISEEFFYTWASEKIYFKTAKKYIRERLPWSHGKESACRCKGHRFHPWPRKTPRTSEHLSLHAQRLSQRSSALRPQLLSPRAQSCASQEEPPAEKPEQREGEGAHPPRERKPAAEKLRHSQSKRHTSRS